MTKPKKIGIVLLTAGAVLVIAALLLFSHNRAEDRRAGESAEETLRLVEAAMAERGVTYMKGDWTNQNPEITRLLEKYGRSGVPLYLLYAGTGEPQVLPQILTD